MLLSQLTADVHFLCGSTSATYSSTNVLRNMNIHYQDAARLIWESDAGWHFQDRNIGGHPLAYLTLTNNVGIYTIPTTAFRIEQVEIKDNLNNWTKLVPVSYKDLNISPETNLIGGIPQNYSLEGNEIRFFPPPVSASVTMASGAAIRLSQNVYTLSAGTQTPGFADPFHRYLSTCTSLDFVQDDKLRQFLIAQRDRISNGMVRFYSKRAEEFPSRIMPQAKRNWRQYQ